MQDFAVWALLCSPTKIFTFEMNFSQCSLEQSACPVCDRQTCEPTTLSFTKARISAYKVWPSALQRQLLYYKKEKK